MEEEWLAKAWEEMQTLTQWRRENGHWDIRRAGQSRHWFEEEVRQGLLAALTADPETREAMRATGDAVARGEATPDAAAAQVLAQLARG